MQFDAAAILFDVDGTLIDSIPAVNRCWAQWADEFDVDHATLLDGFHGVRAAELVKRFIEPDRQPEALDRITWLEMHDLDGVRVLPGAARMLSAVPEGRWAVVTSGTWALMKARMDAVGLPLPDVVVTADNVRHGKPHPEGYATAASKLGVEPAECLVFEDAPAGVHAGLAAGATVVAVQMSHPPEELAAASARVPDLSHVRIGAAPDSGCLGNGTFTVELDP